MQLIADCITSLPEATSAASITGDSVMAENQSIKGAIDTEL